MYAMSYMEAWGHRSTPYIDCVLEWAFTATVIPVVMRISSDAGVGKSSVAAGLSLALSTGTTKVHCVNILGNIITVYIRKNFHQFHHLLS